MPRLPPKRLSGLQKSCRQQAAACWKLQKRPKPKSLRRNSPQIRQTPECAFHPFFMGPASRHNLPSASCQYRSRIKPPRVHAVRDAFTSRNEAGFRVRGFLPAVSRIGVRREGCRVCHGSSSPCGRGRKITVLARERQVVDFSGEGVFLTSKQDPLSCKIYDLAEAKLMILHSPPPMGRRCLPRQRLAKIVPLFPHPSLPCHTHPAPAAGWIANVSVQAGGRPSEAVVTCGRWREEAVHRHCSAGRCLVPPGRAPDQPPEKSLSLVPASAGRQPGRGWKRACGGPSCGYRGRAWRSRAAPWRSRIVNAKAKPVSENATSR
jgi:hypothetical protein